MESISDKMACLSAVWESYAQLIRQRSEKNTEQKLQQRRFVLDKFITQFIQVSMEGKGDIYIGEMRNIGNELSQEFMRNVDAVTRDLTEERATQSLEDYLIRGRGWRLLYTVDRVGIKGVSQRNDLCKVLLNLLPYCSCMKPTCVTQNDSSNNKAGENQDESTQQKLHNLIAETYDSTAPLSSCFQLISKSSKLKQLGCPSLQSRKLRRVESSTSHLSAMKKDDTNQKKARDRMGKKRMTRSTPSKKIRPVQQSETDEEESRNFSDGRQHRLDDRRTKQPRFKRGLKTQMWPSPLKEEDSDTEDDYVGSLGPEVDHTMTITAYHLVRIILHLILSLGKMDTIYNVPSKTLSSTILPHLLYFIVRFQKQYQKEELGNNIKAEKVPDSQIQEFPLNNSLSHTSILQQSAVNTCSSYGEGMREARTGDDKNDREMGKMSQSIAVNEEDVEAIPWEGLARTKILKQTVRTLLTLSGIVATQQGGVRILHKLRVIETLLDLNMLDSLIAREVSNSKKFNRSRGVSSGMEIRVAFDLVCGVFQLMQAIYTNLPFNPSYITDANVLASKLTRPNVATRLKQLMMFSEQYQFSSIELSDQDSFLSTGSLRMSGNDNVPFKMDSPFSADAKVDNFQTTEEKDHSEVISTAKSCQLNSGNPCTFKSNSVESDGKTEIERKPVSTGHQSSQPLDANADLIRCIGSLITVLKGVKVNYIHSIKCLKRRHRNCSYGTYYDHHHDILGFPYYASNKTLQYDNEDADVEQSRESESQTKKLSLEGPPPLRCVVSELANILLDTISEAQSKSSRIHVLSTVRLVGVCCCLQPERIISAIVPRLTVFSPAVRSYALDTLTSILLDQFQGAQENQGHSSKSTNGGTKYSKGWEKDKPVGSEETQLIQVQDSSRCAHCYLEGSSPLLAGLPSTMDSGFSSCDIEEMRRQKLLERWKSLQLLRKIVITKDESIALSCAKHLMTLAIRGNSEIKEKLFFDVYLHVLRMRVCLPGHFPNSSKYQSEDESVNLEKNQTTLQDETALSDKNAGGSSLPFTFSPPEICHSQESVRTSPTGNGSLTPTEISSAEEAACDGLVPSSIMLLCVSALPYVLQVDKVMSMFLAKGGLAKLTNLLEYEQLRAPVMSVFEALVMIDERRLRGNTSDHISVYEGGGVIQTFIDTLAKRTCTVTATLQQISLQSSKVHQTQYTGEEESSAIAGQGKSCENKDFSASTSTSQMKEGSSKLSPETPDLPSTLSESLCSPGGCDELLRSQCPAMTETLPVLLDMWKTCAKLCMNSRMFRACYRESPCLYVVQETLVLALSLLGEFRNSGVSSNSDNMEHSSSSTSTTTVTGTLTPGCSGDNSGKTSNESSSKLNSSISVVETSEDSDTLFHHQAKLEFIEAVMMVCFSCHTIDPSQKRGQEDALWLRLNSALQSCIHLEPSKLSAVFQMLLNVALPRCPSILEYSYSQVVSMLNLREREDIADEDQVRQLVQQGLDEDGETMFTEHGYDGDTEGAVFFDWKKGLEYSLENQAAVVHAASTCPCFPAVFRLFIELMVACHSIASRGVILHTVALRLLQTLRSSQRAVRAVCSENLLEVLINGFRDVLVHCPANGKQSTLQEIILSLVQVIAQKQISATELRLILQLFPQNTETTNSLLSMLLAVIEKSCVHPLMSAMFPVKVLMPMEASDRPSDLDTSMDTPMEQAVWHHSAVEFDVPGMVWPPYPTGFSLALWLCVDQYPSTCKASSSKTGGKDRGGMTHSDIEDTEKTLSPSTHLPMNECLLVVALGNKEKMFEVWVHPKTTSIVCRLTTGVSEVMVLRHIVLDHLLSAGNWHLLVISYIDVLDGSTFVGKMNVIVDGWLKKELILDHPASLNRLKDAQWPFLCVGDARHGGSKFFTGTWTLGTLRLFRGINLSDDFWLQLHCLGPNYEGLGKCDAGEVRASYIPCLSKHMVSVTHLSWDVLVGVSQLPDMDKARETLVIMYRVSHPEIYSTFSIPHPAPVAVHDDLGLVPPAGSQSDLLTQKPLVLSARMRGQVKVREVNTLEKAMERAGGIEAFLFLVAKIFEDSMKAVENGGSLQVAEQLQSKGSHILFQLVHQFPSVAQTFENISGYSMLAKIFTSSLSIVGYPLLKVLMDATTTESVFKPCSTCPQLVLRNHPEGIIRDVNVLTQLLLNWRVWHKANDDVTALLFGALEALVSSTHPYRNFNLRQMQAGGIVNKIFNIYLERIQDGQPSLSVQVSQSASRVVRSLLGSPPDLHLLMAVMDFLLLVHPAPNGFISFTADSFYFKMWWDGMKPRPSNLAERRQAFSQRTAGRPSVADHIHDSHAKVEGASAFDQDPGSDVTDNSHVTLINDDQAHSPDEEDTEFRFPPLKATKSGFEQSVDMDADMEGSDIQIKPPAEGVPGDMLRVDLDLSTSQLTSSSGEKEEKMKKNMNTKDVYSRRIQGISNKTEDGGCKEKKHKVSKRKLMYLRTKGQQNESVTQEDSSQSPEESQSDKNFSPPSPKKKEVTQSDKCAPTSLQKESGLNQLEENLEDDQGLMTLCVSLLEYLTQIILEFPESSLNNVFSKVVCPKSMLVLAKNPSSRMRLAVLKLLGAYLSRAPAGLIDAFIKMDGFFLLANQLRSFPVCTSLVEAAVSILLKQDYVFDENENYTVGDLGELSAVQQVSPALFLSLMDGTASDPNLCKSSLDLLSQLLESTPTMSCLLLDLGLAETLCNLATNIQRRFVSDEEKLMKSRLVDVQHVLCCTVVSEFSWIGHSHYQNVEDMFTLLKALEDHESGRLSETSSKRADTARAFQISLVVKILEYVDKRSEELLQASQGSFSSSINVSTTSSLKSPHSPSRGGTHSYNSFYTASSTPPGTPPHSSSTRYVPPEPSALAFPRHVSKSTLPIMRRSTFSSPDMMGFLSDPQKDEQTHNPHLDSDSSGSTQHLSSPHRSDSGNSAQKLSRFGSLFSRRRKMIYAPVGQSDLLERFRKILVTATDLAVMFPRQETIRPVENRTLNFFTERKSQSLEDRYLKHLFVSVYRFYEHNFNKDNYVKKRRNPIMHGSREILRSQFTRLFLCMMSLKMDFDMRSYTLAFIMTEQRGPDVISAIITDKLVGQELCFYLYNLLASWKNWLNSSQREFGFSMMQLLRRSGFSINSPDHMLNQSQVNALMEEKKQMDARYRKDFAQWLTKREAGTARIVHKYEPVVRRVTEQAMSVTQEVTRLQIEERKKLVAHIKKAMTTQIQLKKQWQEVVQNLTHERGVWYSPASYPQSWQLDPTEGPGRVRKRMQRCHMGIKRQFVLPEHQVKLDAEYTDAPLLFLFEDDHQMSDSAALIYRLYTNEKIQHTCRCTAVSPASESKGELLVGEVCIFFVADGAIAGANFTQQLLGNLDQLSITWPHTDIRELHKRWYQLQDVGLEIFLISGRTCLLAFESSQNRDELYSVLRNSLELPNLIAGESLPAVQKAWLDGEVTNYDYLMHLNKLAGRSYTDLMQYPVFPFVLQDYKSNTLNLGDHNVFRNLKKPIAVQDKTREQRYKDNYEFLCLEAARPHSEEEMIRVAPFHYGSHYSNSGTVLHYLVRVPPFTRMFLTYQDNSFDIPDRTFHSLGTSWRLSSYESSTDVKELIPEFFFLPDFLINNEGFDFGYRQNGLQVNDVLLPPWCENNARQFILVHRQALESEYVTANLHQWIDLVFGYKQQGEEAVRAINVFHPSTYFGVDASAVKEPVKRQALITMIKTYGQTPKQLFHAPHPKCQLRLPSLEAYVRRPVPNVVGVRWGNFVGSPDLSPPVCHTLVDLRPNVIHKLVPLPTGLVFGVERDSSILLLHGKQRDMAVRSTDVMWAGVVTWGYHDNIIRIRSYRDKPLINFLPQHTLGKILCVESVPDCRLLFTAGSAGIISVFTMTHNSSKPSNLQVRGMKKSLYGHSGPITCLYVCQAYSILVSGSSDGTCIIWDLNRLTYVRSINLHYSTIRALTVSDTLGDIATVSQTGLNSCSLQIHSVNACHIASQPVTEIINCVAYSCAPEGKSVNVVAGGTESGLIRLWSSWDLTPLRDLERSFLRPIISLVFTSDAQYLMASSVDGSVVIWSKDEKLTRRQIEKFIPVINFRDDGN